MKNVFLVLVFLSGFATVSFGQSCKPTNCTPCPPGCCFINCCTAKGAAASTQSTSTDVAFAAFFVEGQKSGERPECISRKDWKACQVTCKSAATVQTTAASTPAPACRPASSGTTTSTRATALNTSPTAKN